MAAAQKWVGQPLKRAEDPRLLSGQGIFIADQLFPNVHHAAVLRSPHAHARIRSIDATAALRAAGVAGVVTGQDALKMTRPFAVGVRAPVKYYCMAIDKVRFVGEPVAVVQAAGQLIRRRAAF